jgi:hypothetical protein
LILQLLSVPALLLLVNGMVDDQGFREEGRFHHVLPMYMVEASSRQYFFEGVVVACCHCS